MRNYKFLSHAGLFLAVWVHSATATAPTLHVAWSGSPPPQTPDDYQIDYATDPDYPSVELKTGNSGWRIWSTDPDNPNGIGDIGTISSPHPQNFVVRVEGDSSTPGARTVKGIVLDPQGSGSDSNYSNVAASRITGNLQGNLTVQRSSGATGGEATLTVDGNVSSSSTITAPVLKSLVIAGDLAGDINITTKIDDGVLQVDGSVASTAVIDVTDLVGTGARVIFNDELTDEFNGTLILRSGIPDGSQIVAVNGALTSTGTIDLNNHDIYGGLAVMRGSGSIINGGVVKTNGGVSFNSLVDSASSPFSGDITVSSVETDGVISVEIGSPSASSRFRGTWPAPSCSIAAVWRRAV